MGMATSRVSAQRALTHTKNTKYSLENHTHDPKLVLSRPGNSGLATLVVVPRYTDIPTDSNLFFELLLFIYCVVALGLQYINIYRTIWWIPNSYNNYAMSFYLVDTNLILFLSVFMARRLVWCFLVEVTASKNMTSPSFWLVPLGRLRDQADILRS
jgi:hypothetical protein